MNAEGFDVQALLRMEHSPIKNYAIPGLTSSLIGAPSAAGTIRMFRCEREHQEAITPHSHRFNFQCWVLRGSVRNRIWTKTYNQNPAGDLFQRTKLIYEGDVGHYQTEACDIGNWKYSDQEYSAGQCYSMRADEVHSIFFSRGALVLFFEGPTEANSSIILEPCVDGEVVPTFKVEPWMFKRETL